MDDPEAGELKVHFVATLVGATTTAIRNMPLKIEATIFASGCATMMEKDLTSFNLLVKSVHLEPGSARVTTQMPPTALGSLNFRFSANVTPLMVKTPSFTSMFSSSIAGVLNLAPKAVSVKFDAGFDTATNIGAKHEAPWTSSCEIVRDESDMPDLTDSTAIQKSLFDPELFGEGEGYSKYGEKRRRANAKRRKAWLWHWTEAGHDEESSSCGPVCKSTGDDWRQFNCDERFYIFSRCSVPEPIPAP